MSKRERVALVDGDIIAYRCGFAAEHKTYHATIDGKPVTFDSKTELNKYLKDNPDVQDVEWESELHVEPIDHVLSTVKHMLANIKAAIKADKVYLFLSDRKNFRDEIATVQKYKGNRDNMRRPLHHEAVIRYLTDVHHAIQMPNLEADDLLADELTTRTAAGQFTVLASIDKDLLQVPGKHYNFVTGKKLVVTPEQGMRTLFEQMLVGDGTDNVPGIIGVGPVTAKKMLADVPDDHDELVAAVINAWDMALDPEKYEWLDSRDEYLGDLHYKHWQTGEELTVSIGKFVREINKLLKVGVPTGQAVGVPQ